jgi:hypothetical protein
MGELTSVQVQAGFLVARTYGEYERGLRPLDEGQTSVHGTPPPRS